MAKQIEFSDEARASIKAGVDAVANAVKTTLGPKGRNVALDRKFGAPTVTHDGVTVAKEIELKDPFENMGAQMLKEAATKTNDVAGDGTTTATVLAQAMVHEGLKNLAAGANPMLLKRGIERRHPRRRRAHQRAWPSRCRAATTSPHIATISAADPEIGNLIADVMEKVGKDGVITVEESRGLQLRDRVRRGHGVRPRLHLRLLRHQHRAHDRRDRRSLHPDHRQEDLGGAGHSAGAGEDAADGPQGRS